MRHLRPRVAPARGAPPGVRPNQPASRRPPPPRPQDLPPADAFCLAIARAVLGSSTHVKVASVEGQQLIVVEVSAPADDVGRLVGRDGRTIGAVRVLAEALGLRIGKRVMVDVQAAARGR